MTHPKVLEFSDAVDALLDEWWPIIGPNAHIWKDEDKDDEDEDPVPGGLVPSGWVLGIESQSFDDPDDCRVARYHKRFMSPMHASGISYDIAQTWAGR